MRARRLTASRLFIVLLALSLRARAADYPAPAEADWIAHDFKFHTGETLPELRLHYTTVGVPSGDPVLVLHGTAGSGTGMLSPAFAGELFGSGQPLDARRYFIILPDAIGAGKSARPSDGLRTKFPSYDYADMVLAQYRLVTEGLGLHHLRLVLGNSMGGMETWVWAEAYPDFMDAVVPMASQPTAMSGRNWMLRRMLIETIKADPAYMNGDYTAQPPFMHIANVFFALATNGGTLSLQARAPTRAAADQIVDRLMGAPAPPDANDFLYQWNASADYDPEPGLDRITAPVLAINSADDERNPPQTGVMDRAMANVKFGELFLIPASEKTYGHGTTSNASFWAERLRTFLAEVPSR